MLMRPETLQFNSCSVFLVKVIIMAQSTGQVVLVDLCMQCKTAAADIGAGLVKVLASRT